MSFGGIYFGQTFVEDTSSSDLSLIPSLWFGGMYFGETYGDPSSPVIVPPEKPVPIEIKPFTPRGQVIYPTYRPDTEERDRLDKQIREEDLELYSIIQSFLICNN